MKDDGRWTTDNGWQRQSTDDGWCMTDHRVWMAEDEWRMTDGGRQTMNGGWQMMDDRWQRTDDRWQMMDNGWQRTDDGRRILDDGRQMTDEGRRMTDDKSGQVQSELSARGTKRDVENTSKCTCLDCIPARWSSLGPPPVGRHRT